MVTETILREGYAGYVPRGVGHYFINTNETHDAYLVVMLNQGRFTNVDITALLSNVPPQVSLLLNVVKPCRAVLGTSQEGQPDRFMSPRGLLPVGTACWVLACLG